MICSLIAAVASNGIIGRNGRLPWILPPDLRRFRDLTMGHHLVLGRCTFEGLDSDLPGRRMVVLSHGRPAVPAGATVVSSLARAMALAEANGEQELLIGGGGAVYQAALGLADRIYLTRIDAVYKGDTSFPALTGQQWRLVSREDHQLLGDHDGGDHDAGAPPLSYSFLVYERQRSASP